MSGDDNARPVTAKVHLVEVSSEALPAWQIREAATVERKRLLKAGFTPIPVIGKSPAISEWQKTVASDHLIDRWFSTQESALNTGILTRDTPTADIDVMHSNLADDIEIQLYYIIHGERVPVRTGLAPKRAVFCRTDTPFKKIKTPTFRSPDGLIHKVEVLGDGQQVVVAGVHPDTQLPYTWRDSKIGDVTWNELPTLTEAQAQEFIDNATAMLTAQPDWVVVKKVGNGAAEPSVGASSDYHDLYSEPASRADRNYAKAALEGECQRLRMMPRESGRNDELNIAGCKLGGFIPRYLSRATVEQELYQASVSNMLVHDTSPRQVRATIQSGLSKGLQTPRVIPERSYASEPRDDLLVPDTPLNEWDAGLDREPIPPREWLLGNIFCRKFGSSLLGDGGAGKTATRYPQYLSLAIGRSLTGEYVHHRSRVLIVSLEDTKDEMRRRLAATMIHHGINQDDLVGWLILAAPGIGVGKLLTMDQRGRVETGALASKLEEAIVKHKIDLISLDPLVKLHGVDENNNNAMDAVCGILTDLAIRLNIAVDVPHHMNKATADPGNAKKGRGASSTKDAFRLVYTLQTMSDDEAKEFGVPEAERRRLIRMDSAKVNIAPPADDAIWFRLVGVRINNGSALYPNGDEVQTVESWSPPKVFEDLTIPVINTILNVIDAGLPDGNRYSDAPNAKDRAAWQVVLDHCPTKTESQARKVIKTWKLSGLLTTAGCSDPTARKTVRGLQVDNSKRPK